MTEERSVEALVRALADQLSMPLDEEAVATVTARARELRDDFADRRRDPEPAAESVGVRSDDEYNALLAVYDEPRTTASRGPLDGLSLAIKDNIAVRGLTMTCGSTEFASVPSFDATVVERLLDAGASIVGKANMDAFAFGPAGEWSEFGRVRNPVAEGRVPGGSSSGSAAAVAGGLADAALGSDTGGSVRVPAACCGLVGVKPSHRLVPRFGFAGNVPFTDTIGPLARDVETAARLLDVIAGPDPRDPTSMAPRPDLLSDALEVPDSMTVGFVESALDLVDDAVGETLVDVADALDTHSGITVEPVTLAFPDDLDFAYSLVIGADYASLCRQSFTPRGEGTGYDAEWAQAFDSPTYNTHIAERVLPGAAVDELTDGRAYVAARRVATRFTEQLYERFEDVDVLLAPTLRMLPPEYGDIQSAEDGLKYSLCKPFSLTGAPAVSVPAGTVDGLPVGAQAIAPLFEDGRALQCARAIERLTA